jgi:prevent-host-death family protein
MAIIKPISDLRDKFDEISKICHKEGEPVYITKNGKGDLVVMSITRYEKQEALLELYQKLSIAEQQSESGVKRISHDEMIKRLNNRLYEIRRIIHGSRKYSFLL